MKLSSYQGHNSYTFLCFYCHIYEDMSFAMVRGGFVDSGTSINETIL